MRVVVIRHHQEDSAGFIGDAFEARGAQLSTLLFPTEGALPDLAGLAHIVVLGSTSSVYDDGAARAWIEEELAWLRRADAAGVPVLGICFGAQTARLRARRHGRARRRPGDRLGQHRYVRRQADPAGTLAGVPSRPVPAAAAGHGAGP